MRGLIPRLVLDEDEVSKIIHDTCDEEVQSDNGISKNKSEENDKNDSNEDFGIVDIKSSTLMLQKMSLPGFMLHLQKLFSKICKVIVSLRTAPNVIKQVILELPAHIGSFVTRLPSISRQLKTIIFTWISIGKNEITTSISNAVNIIKDLPHRATFQWRHLIGVLTVLIFCPLLGEVVFFLPMKSVDKCCNSSRVSP